MTLASLKLYLGEIECWMENLFATESKQGCLRVLCFVSLLLNFRKRFRLRVEVYTLNIFVYFDSGEKSYPNVSLSNLLYIQEHIFLPM